MDNYNDGLSGLNESQGYGDVPTISEDGLYVLKPTKHEMAGFKAVKTLQVHWEVIESTSAKFPPGSICRMPIWGFGDPSTSALRKLKAYICALFKDRGLTPASKTDFVSLVRQTIADPTLIHAKIQNGAPFRTVKASVRIEQPAVDPKTGQQKKPDAKPFALYTWL